MGAQDPEYRFAAVGHPSRDYLWIPSRTRSLDPEIYDALLARIEAKGYDLERLKRTPQPPDPATRAPRALDSSP